MTLEIMDKGELWLCFYSLYKLFFRNQVNKNDLVQLVCVSKHFYRMNNDQLESWSSIWGCRFLLFEPSHMLFIVVIMNLASFVHTR